MKFTRTVEYERSSLIFNIALKCEVFRIWMKEI